MPTFDTVRHVPYPPEAMLDLVADVERYPEFVPLCEAMKVMSQSVTSDGARTVVARMSVGYGPLRESFTSKVTIARQLRRIDVSYLDGPFRSMQNRWLFLPTPTGCDVDFHITYEFRSLPLQLLLGAMFERAFRKFAEAFEARARKIYGPPLTENADTATDKSQVAPPPALRPAR